MATSARSRRSFGLTADDYTGLDVGSPFDYGTQAILYVARHLPPPGRDGLGPAQLDEIVELVDAAGGRTLGLFSSRRAAETAAEEVRRRLPHLTTLAQGDAQLPELAKQFVGDPHTCLFGTLSLWQGLDVPGETCQLVLIDRIPFPRPDDPLMSARARAADKDGRNGFMEVSATHAALLLAQGSGRLIRTTTDRGVVAVLDPRLATARYGGFLRASLAPMWSTTDPAVVRKALARLAELTWRPGQGLTSRAVQLRKIRPLNTVLPLLTLALELMITSSTCLTRPRAERHGLAAGGPRAQPDGRHRDPARLLVDEDPRGRTGVLRRHVHREPELPVAGVGAGAGLEAHRSGSSRCRTLANHLPVVRFEDESRNVLIGPAGS